MGSMANPLTSTTWRIRAALRLMNEVMDQIGVFLEAGNEGTVINPCGGPCTDL